jgi:hypothetical protein
MESTIHNSIWIINIEKNNLKCFNYVQTRLIYYYIHNDYSLCIVFIMLHILSQSYTCKNELDWPLLLQLKGRLKWEKQLAIKTHVCRLSKECGWGQFKNRKSQFCKVNKSNIFQKLTSLNKYDNLYSIVNKSHFYKLWKLYKSRVILLNVCRILANVFIYQ